MPHIYEISGSGLKLTITGARDVQVNDIHATLGLLDGLADGAKYQLFDAGKVAGPDHIYYAAANAAFAMGNGINISNNLKVETLLYAACENQINKAIEFLGVSKTTETIAVAIFSEKSDNRLAEDIAAYLGTVDDSVLDISQEKYESIKRLYEITETAIETIDSDRNTALTSLIAEKGALLSLRR
jgi:tRNA threonylcarbamoyladenosine modification (KEOPS) complex Cgi121 subunit